MRTHLMGRASSFAHMVGLGRGGRRAEDPPKDDEEPKGKKSRAADDDENPDQYPDDDDTKGKKSRAADDEPDDEDEEPKGKKSRAADDEPDDEDEEPKGKKSRAADDDDDDDEEEMSGKSAAASARRRERARCAAIFGHSAAATNVALACSLAFETTLVRSEAIKVLKSQAGRTSERRAEGGGFSRDRNTDLGTGAVVPGGKAAIKGSWDAAIAKAVPAARK